MPRRADGAWEWDDELDDEDEVFDQDGESEDDDEPTVACPYCRHEIHEDAQQCPYCRSFISSEDAPPRKPWWLVLGVGACLYVVYRWLIPW